jgi:chromosome segregation ATPase
MKAGERLWAALRNTGIMDAASGERDQILTDFASIVERIEKFITTSTASEIGRLMEHRETLRKKYRDRKDSHVLKINELGAKRSAAGDFIRNDKSQNRLNAIAPLPEYPSSKEISDHKRLVAEAEAEVRQFKNNFAIFQLEVGTLEAQLYDLNRELAQGKAELAKVDVELRRLGVNPDEAIPAPADDQVGAGMV